MKRLLLIPLLLLSALFSEYQCQDDNLPDNDSIIMSFVHIKQGDVYIGIITDQNDSVVTLNDQFMGIVSIQRKKISRIENVFQNTSLIVTLGENVRYTGKLIEVDETNYTLQSELIGEFKIPRDKIVGVEILEGEGEMSTSPNATRYFFAPSAIPIEKGEGYYHNAYLLSNSANFGITKNFSLGGGVVIPLLFYVTPKVGFKVRKNLYVGTGLIAATTIIPDALISGGIPFGLVTVGNMENNFTAGVGYGFIWNQGDFQKTDYPIINLNGMTRISNRIQLVTENWFIPYVRENESDNSYQDANGNWIELPPTVTESKEIALAFTLGTRIILNNKTSFDISPLYLTGTGNNGIVIPYLDFVYKF